MDFTFFPGRNGRPVRKRREIEKKRDGHDVFVGRRLPVFGLVMRHVPVALLVPGRPLLVAIVMATVPFAIPSTRAILTTTLALTGIRLTVRTAMIAARAGIHSTLASTIAAEIPTRTIPAAIIPRWLVATRTVIPGQQTSHSHLWHLCETPVAYRVSRTDVLSVRGACAFFSLRVGAPRPPPSRAGRLHHTRARSPADRPSPTIPPSSSLAPHRRERVSPRS